MSQVLLTGSGGFIGRRMKQVLEARGYTVCDPRWAGHGFLGWGEDFRKSEYIIHLGALTNIDYSIHEPELAIRENFDSTMSMLEVARHLPKLLNFIFVSTAEVYGPTPPGRYWFENQPYNCTNPYAASKAAGEQFVLAYAHSYSLPLCIATTMNVFGEGQPPQKFIPTVIRNVLTETPVGIHADKRGNPGSRCYIHVDDVCSALCHLAEEGMPSEKYHVAGEDIDNLLLASRIAEIVKKPLKYEFVDFHSSRPGHELRYAIKDTKLWMHWKPQPFDERLRQTVEACVDARAL